MSWIRGNRLLRFADRYVGIPVVSSFVLLPKRRAPAPETIRRIGVQKTVAVGDTLMLAGILDDLRRQFPAATLILVTGQDNLAAARLMMRPGDESVVTSPLRPWASIRAIRRSRLDVLIDIGPWVRFDAMLAALSGARYRVGFKTRGESRHYGYDRAVEYSSEMHEIDNFRRLAETIGIRDHSRPHVEPPRTLSHERIPGRPYVVFHPWAGGYRHELKEWSTESWVALARAMAAKGQRVLLTGSAADRPQSAELAAAIAAAGVPALDAAGTFTLAELADVLVASEVVVTVNTGVMHLSAELGARTISLDGPTSNSRWGPIGPRVRSVESSFEGCGYLNLGWEYAGHRVDCMQGIAVDAVLRAVDELTAT